MMNNRGEQFIYSLKTDGKPFPLDYTITEFRKDEDLKCTFPDGVGSVVRDNDTILNYLVKGDFFSSFFRINREKENSKDYIPVELHAFFKDYMMTVFDKETDAETKKYVLTTKNRENKKDEILERIEAKKEAFLQRFSAKIQNTIYKKVASSEPDELEYYRNCLFEDEEFCDLISRQYLVEELGRRYKILMNLACKSASSSRLKPIMRLIQEIDYAIAQYAILCEIEPAQVLESSKQLHFPQSILRSIMSLRKYADEKDCSKLVLTDIPSLDSIPGHEHEPKLKAALDKSVHVTSRTNKDIRDCARKSYLTSLSAHKKKPAFQKQYERINDYLDGVSNPSDYDIQKYVVLHTQEQFYSLWWNQTFNFKPECSTVDEEQTAFSVLVGQITMFVLENSFPLHTGKEFLEKANIIQERYYNGVLYHPFDPQKSSSMRVIVHKDSEDVVLSVEPPLERTTSPQEEVGKVPLTPEEISRIEVFNQELKEIFSIYMGESISDYAERENFSESFDCEEDALRFLFEAQRQALQKMGISIMYGFAVEDVISEWRELKNSFDGSLKLEAFLSGVSHDYFYYPGSLLQSILYAIRLGKLYDAYVSLIRTCVNSYLEAVNTKK